MKIISQIVIIDDNKMDCFINQKISALTFEKANIKTFNSSVLALDYFNSLSNEQEEFPANNVDLILLDINMPLMNGFEFLKNLKKTNLFTTNQVAIYFLSSSNIEKDISEALCMESCSGYIMKPLTKDKLMNALISKDKNEYFSLNTSSIIRSNLSNDVA